MDKALKLDPIQPRFLRYRGHYKIYVMGFMLLAFLLSSFWFAKFYEDGAKSVLQYQSLELYLTGLFYIISTGAYFFWLRPSFKRSVQVFSDRVMVHNSKVKEEYFFSEVESARVVGWSIFYVKMKDGFKIYFNSSLERVDYIWEGLYQARPDLMSEKEFEDFRLKLVQYDHHQKRKEWFFKHKMVDVFNWAVLPLMFLVFAHIFQSKSVQIHQEGLYFFRLLMFSLLVLLSTAFLYSMVLKKLIFDRKVARQFGTSEEKVRDIEFEGIILQRSKIFQFLTACFVLALLVKLDVNLYSISKVKDDVASFNLKKGHTIVVDNRYNCVACKYELVDGDLVLFGRGVIGQVLAKEGDIVGLVAHDTRGRTIASENVQEVPKGHVAIKASNGKDIVFIKIQDLIGKIQK